MKNEGHLGRCYLLSDAANVIRSAAGYNFHLVDGWPKALFRSTCASAAPLYLLSKR